MLAEAPEWLSDEARQVWDRRSGEVRPGADPDAFAAYCSAAADFARAQELLNRTGPLVQGAGGRLTRSPLQAVKNGNEAIMRQLRPELFGEDDPLPKRRPLAHRNAQATERTIEALAQGGRLEQVDDAILELVRTIAGALDHVDPESYPAQMASLARVQLAAIKMLRGQHDDTDALSDLLAALSSKVGDAPES
jgi:P27 family predicted phage terminase small subunit